MLMRWQGLFVVLGVLALVAAGSAAVAQDSQEPSEVPADQAAVPEEEEAESKLPFALYVYASGGMFEADPFNTSIATSLSETSQNALSLEEILGARAEIGWKLPNKKGDFRLSFQGYAEDKYRFTAVGRSAQTYNSGLESLNVLEDLDWWNLDVENGRLSAVRNPPLWDEDLDDANDNDSIDRSEVRYGTPDLSFTRNITDDLQNRAQHIEVTYGREFGGRRYSGRWWGGLRSYKYEGNVLAAGWLNNALPGQGYTDGTVLRFLNLAQKTTGLGPTGALEANFNFFEKRLVLYARGQAAFMVADLEVDTGKFFTLVLSSDEQLVVPVEARLRETRSKSTWQTGGELGVRANLKKGVTLELAWSITGYLDSLLLVSNIQIPGGLGQATQGTSAIYNTHDIVLDGTRFGVGFQF